MSVYGDKLTYLLGPVVSSSSFCLFWSKYFDFIVKISGSNNYLTPSWYFIHWPYPNYREVFKWIHLIWTVDSMNSDSQNGWIDRGKNTHYEIQRNKSHRTGHMVYLPSDPWVVQNRNNTALTAEYQIYHQIKQ